MGLFCNRTFEFGLKISRRRCASVKHGIQVMLPWLVLKFTHILNATIFGKDLLQCEHGTGAVHEMVGKMVLVPDF